MTATARVETRQASAAKLALPSELKELIEIHLEGLVGFPTVEVVETICKDPAARSHKEQVLKYFLVESPLRTRDLSELLFSIGQNRARNLCQEAARIRTRRVSLGRTPRWGDANPS